VVAQLGSEPLRASLRQMLAIRHFEIRGEAAYQQGKAGGFFHAYIGQEAIATAAVAAMGPDNWWVTSYRCHGYALLLGATARECMAELYGRATGNAKGRGGSMHLYTDKLLGGMGIVGGQIPVGVGAGFAIKYFNQREKVSVCVMGDGAVAQGTFHESLNMAALWNLPVVFVIENNLWGMGTAVERAVSVPNLAETKAPSFGMEGFVFDGSDFFNCYAGFHHVHQRVLETQRPVLVECLAERFRGHSISDPATYRSKEHLQRLEARDPIFLFKDQLIAEGLLTQSEFEAMDKEERERVLDAMRFADESPWPDPATLEQGVYAP